MPPTGHFTKAPGLRRGRLRQGAIKPTSCLTLTYCDLLTAEQKTQAVQKCPDARPRSSEERGVLGRTPQRRRTREHSRWAFLKLPLRERSFPGGKTRSLLRPFIRLKADLRGASPVNSPVSRSLLRWRAYPDAGWRCPQCRGWPLLRPCPALPS